MERQAERSNVHLNGEIKRFTAALVEGGRRTLTSFILDEDEELQLDTTTGEDNLKPEFRLWLQQLLV